MDFINHYDNGARGLRIAASVCIVLGYIALCFCIIATIVAKDVIFGVPLLFGITAWCIMYLTACSIRAAATRTEAAQLYIDNNTQEENQDDE